MATTPRFALFRAADARDFEESGIMSQHAPTATELTGAVAAIDAGMLEGTTVKLLFEAPGLSLTHAWFKSGFPLPRHTHDVDCTYYIVAGSLRIGTENLAKGDGFFVGVGVPYHYVPGPDGVEILEFRGSNSFDIKLLADNPAFWSKAVDKVAGRRKVWANEVPPSSAPSQPNAENFTRRREAKKERRQSRRDASLSDHDRKLPLTQAYRLRALRAFA